MSGPATQHQAAIVQRTSDALQLGVDQKTVSRDL